MTDTGKDMDSKQEDKQKEGYDTLYIKADDWVPAMLRLMESGKEVKIKPQGNSMYPFLRNQRDYVIFRLPDRKLRRGDIVLYRRDGGQHVVHRIHHVGKDGFYMVGDNQTGIEGPLRREQILAITVKIIRKGKQIDCRKNIGYRILSALWLWILPFRNHVIHKWERYYGKIHKKAS